MAFASESLPHEGIPIVTPGGGAHALRTPLSQVRPSSIVLVRLNGNIVGMQRDEKPSWWDQQDLELHSMTGGDMVRLLVDMVLLLLVPVVVFLVAHFSSNRALAFVYLTFLAIATYEYAWLAYRVRLRVFLPFKLHQKQTCRDIYAQIMSYSVDLRTCTITPLAERLCCGRQNLAASFVSAVISGIVCGVAFACIDLSDKHGVVVLLYVTLSVFLGFVVALLSPNLPDSIVVLLRFAYFCCATLNLLLKHPDDDRPHIEHHPVTMESYSLLMVASCLMLICRVLTSKDAMESAVMVFLDLTGILYLSCAATVLEFFSRSTSANGDHALLGFFLIVWSSELGSYLVGRILAWMQSTYNHPIAKHISSRQSVEKLVGALLFGISATLISAQLIEYRMPAYVVAILSATAIVFSQICKLFLISLKKVANVSATAEYLRIGGGVVDRLDTLLFMAIVFCPYFERNVFD